AKAPRKTPRTPRRGFRPSKKPSYDRGPPPLSGESPGGGKCCKWGRADSSGAREKPSVPGYGRPRTVSSVPVLWMARVLHFALGSRFAARRPRFARLAPAVCGLLLVGAGGCGRTPEADAERALARLRFIARNSGESIQYDEASLDRPPVGASFRDTFVLDGALIHVGRIPTIRKLDLTDASRITDHGLAFLQDLPDLRVLHLRGTAVTDAGLEHLGQITRLESLALSRTAGVTDAGMQHLRGLTNLRALDLSETNVTDHGSQELKHFLPNVNITRKGGPARPRP